MRGLRVMQPRFDKAGEQVETFERGRLQDALVVVTVGLCPRSEFVGSGFLPNTCICRWIFTRNPYFKADFNKKMRVFSATL